MVGQDTSARETVDLEANTMLEEFTLSWDHGLASVDRVRVDYTEGYNPHLSNFVGILMGMLMPGLAELVLPHLCDAFETPKEKCLLVELARAQTPITPIAERLRLQRMAIGALTRVGWAFVWQEKKIPGPHIQSPKANSFAARMQPLLLAVIDTISQIPHEERRLEEAHNVYPNDEYCWKTDAHTKWHELTAGAIYDLGFLANEVIGAKTGMSFNIGSQNWQERVSRVGMLLKKPYNPAQF